MGDCIMRVPLFGRGKVVRAWATVDAERYAEVTLHTWSLSDGYAICTSGVLKGTGMHRLVLGLVRHDGLCTDHRNRNRLDNRAANLRVATRPQNQQNLPGQAWTSRHRGVSWNRHAGKWHVQHKLDGVVHYLGLYVSEDEAGRVAAEWRAEHMPFSEDAARRAA